MPLNLSINDGEMTPYIKYNAKAGRWYVKPEGGGDEVEVDKPRLAFNMAAIKTGWIYYQEGVGPEKVWDPSPTQMAPKPPGPRKFKRGFEVMVFGPDTVPGVGIIGLREFSSTATNCITAILGMYADYEAQVGKHPNEVPVYACLGVKPIQGAYGTNYEPQFVLKQWIGRDKVPAFEVQPDDAAIGWENGNQQTAPHDDWQAPVTPRQAPPPADDDLNDPIPF